jgi:RNA polymerase primary sigma factor
VELHDLNDPVAMYVREVATIKPLTNEEHLELFRQLGSRSAWNDEQENLVRRLIVSQLALVVNIAERHSFAAISMLDLIQEGNIGLMNAVRSFAEKPGANFTAYAAARIEEAIANLVTNSK